MKLDKIKFARVIGLVTKISGRNLFDDEMLDLDAAIDIDLPVAEQTYASVSDVNMLMSLMAAGDRKIEAIKLHRKLTGWGLRESKDQVEKYWISKGHYVPPEHAVHKTGSDIAARQRDADKAEGATLGDILGQALAK